MAKKTKGIRIYIRRYREPEGEIDYPAIVLTADNWNDYGYITLFYVTFCPSADERIELGGTKIANGTKSFDWERRKQPMRLPPTAYSLGQSVSFYRAVKEGIAFRYRKGLLQSLRDVVVNPKLKQKYTQSLIWEKSLLRDMSARQALSRGGFYIGSQYKRKKPPKFDFFMHVPGAILPHVVNFDFSRHKGLPHRINLIVGRNGTGKTTCLAALACTLAPGREHFRSDSVRDIPTNAGVANLDAIGRVIAISYNAFDQFPIPDEPNIDDFVSGELEKARFSYRYCGLRNLAGQIDLAEIQRMFLQSLKAVRKNERVPILGKILRNLMGAAPEGLETESSIEDKSLFKRLSAGQKLVTALVTDIVGFIEEGSLLLVDEPETHLHPGLLTTFLSILFDILKEFDSFAIVSTHSPILLQQVPSRYVRVFGRIGDAPNIRPLHVESFGEDLGELTRQVLGLSEPERDFTDVLGRLYKSKGSLEAVQNIFEHGLGLPALAFLESLSEDGE